MCCPISERLNQDHVQLLNAMRTAYSWEEALRKKTSAQVAWTAVIEHRRSCKRCRVRAEEMASSAGMPAWQAGLY